MKRILVFVVATVLVLSFSAFVLAQQATTTTQQKQEAAKMEHKATMAHKEHIKLTKEEIISLQEALAKAGYFKGKATGVLGAATKRALREYQKANNLKVTGMPNEETLTKLGVSYSAATTAKATPTEKKEAEKPEAAKKP